MVQRLVDDRFSRLPTVLSRLSRHDPHASRGLGLWVIRGCLGVGLCWVGAPAPLWAQSNQPNPDRLSPTVMPLPDARQSSEGTTIQDGSTPALNLNVGRDGQADRDEAEKLRRYRLGPNDQIFVNVTRFPDFNFQGSVNPEGAIVLPLVGNLILEGLTLSEAQEAIRVALDRYIVDPQVSLSLLAQRPVQVTIVGEVTRPGFYPLQSTRISDALIAAGGSLASGDLRQVQVRRTLANGSVVIQDLDLYTPLETGLPLPTVRLEDGDVVVVPALDQLNDPDYNDRLVATSTLAKPTIAVRVLSYAANGVDTLTLPAGSRFRDALDGMPLDRANLRKIALIRYNPETGNPITTEIDGRSVLMGDPVANVALQDNDVVVVGQNLITNISRTFGRLTQPFRDVLGFLLFFDSLNQNAQNLFRPSAR